MGSVCCCLGDDAADGSKKDEESNEVKDSPKDTANLHTPLLKETPEVKIEPVVPDDPEPPVPKEREPVIAKEPEPVVEEIAREPEEDPPATQEEQVASKEDLKTEAPKVDKEVVQVGGGAVEVEGAVPEDDIVEMLQEPKLKRISAEKVNDMWVQKRGADADDPLRKNIEHAISKSDTNKNGKLEMEEMQRLTGAFVRHSGGDVNMTSEKLFTLLDENSDGVLTFQEVLTTFKAMYLMKSNGVELDELLQDIEE